MHGNNPNAGMAGTQLPGAAPNGVSPDDLNTDDRESLRSFATEITSATESYLPHEFMVNSAYTTSRGILSLDIRVFCPDGNQIQCEVRPDTEPSDSLTDEEIGEQNVDTVTEISQQLAAAAVHQSMQARKMHGGIALPAK